MTKHLCLAPGQRRGHRESFRWLIALVLVIVGLPVVLYVATREELHRPVGFANIENLEKAIDLDLPPHTQLLESCLGIVPGELIVLAAVRLPTTELALFWDQAHMEPEPGTAEDLRAFHSWWQMGVLARPAPRPDEQMFCRTLSDTKSWDMLVVLAVPHGSGRTTLYLVSVQ